MALQILPLCGVTSRDFLHYMPRHDSVAAAWWRGGVIYQIYPRSWNDSDGDGVGDIRGIIAKLDYLRWLGVDAIWLNPITASPDVDWGYDVSDYRTVHPALGALADVDELIATAAERSIAVVFDIVPSHTSDRHPWFVDARSSRSSPYRDYYVWRPPAPDGSCPNNWVSSFEGPAWSFDESTGEYYMHTFSPHQPQLNWWSPRVRAEFDAILEFWFDRGIAGVRIDAVQAVLYDPELRDNPPAGPADTPKEKEAGQTFLYNGNHPGTHEIVRHWRAIASRYDPPRLLFGETWFLKLNAMATYYGSGDDELDLAWNVPFLQCRLSANHLREMIRQTFAMLPARAWPAWAVSTHDYEGRMSDRWCHGEPRCIRCALLLLLTLRGTPIVYYGDEIGMTAPPAVRMAGAMRDRVKSAKSRDATRTPMQWTADTGAGFTTSPTPWLPIGDAKTANVKSQMADASSILSFVRDLLVVRREVSTLATGAFELVDSATDILAWRRDDVLVALNLGTTAGELDASGTIAICTDRGRDGERVRSPLRLASMQGVVVTPEPERSSGSEE